MTSEFLELPGWSKEYADQFVFFEQLKTMLTNQKTDIFANISLPIQVDSAVEPNQAQWEAAWIAAGYTLPIQPSATLIWWDTTNNVSGGSFGSTPTSSGTVYSRDTLYAPGTTCFADEESLSSSVSSSVSLGVTPTNHPLITFTLPRDSDLFVTYELYVHTAGSGSWGGDFLLDGAKVGTLYYGLPLNVGISQISQPGRLFTQARIPNVPAGDHTLRALMGVVLSPLTPPTLVYGGLTTYGLRTLTVRAVTL